MAFDLTLLPSEETPLGRALVGFYRWWIEGLRKVLPRRGETARGDTLRIVLESNRLRLATADGIEQPWSAESGALAPDFVAALRAARGNRALVVELAADLALIKTLRLPALGRDELEAAIGYQLTSATPFPPDQLFSGQQVASRDAKGMEVELIAVPKRFVEPLLQTLVDAGIGAPQRLVVSGHEGVNLLPRADTSNGGARRIGWRLPLLLLLGLLLAALMVVPVWKKRAQLIKLETELAVVKKQAAPLLKSKDRAMKLQKSLSELARPSERTPTELEIIERLSALLPDTDWLIEMRFTKGRIQLRGEAAHAVDVLERLQNAAEFTDARFLSPVSKNRRTGRENFHIEIRAVAS